MSDHGPGWLDMDAYPELDLGPDDPALGQLRDILRDHEIAPLPDGDWEAALHAAIAEGEPADVAWQAGAGAETGGWWPDHGTGSVVDHHPSPGPHDLTDPYGPPDPHPDGGHW
ncbi:MAG: hypothetical protein ACRDOA_18475 [Streptosporangiaceae bacterium]